MTRLRGLPLAGVVPLLAVLVLTAACAQATSAGAGGDDSWVPTSYTDDDIVVRVEQVGGFVPVEVVATRLPIVTVYGDGRVVTEGPVPAIYPGPALPNVQVQQISRDDVARLARRAVEAGVGRTTDFGLPQVTDAPSTRFTVLTATGHEYAEAYALGFDDESLDGLTADQRAARAKMQDLLAALTDLPATLGADAVGPAEPYQPDALAAFVSPWSEPADEAIPAPPELAWVGPALPGEPIGEALSLRCVTVTGAEASELLDRAADATTLTPWVSGGDRWRVAFRPLLPGETACADLWPN